MGLRLTFIRMEFYHSFTARIMSQNFATLSSCSSQRYVVESYVRAPVYINTVCAEFVAPTTPWSGALLALLLKRGKNKKKKKL